MKRGVLVVIGAVFGVIVGLFIGLGLGGQSESSEEQERCEAVDVAREASGNYPNDAEREWLLETCLDEAGK